MADNIFYGYFSKQRDGKILEILLYLIIPLAIWYFYSWLHSRKYKLPPGPCGVPILGYLPFLGSEPYRDLDRLSKKYGNVFSLYLGQTYVVILGDYVAVKEAFSKSTTTDRPERLFDFIPDGVGFSSVNGQEWVEQRRYSVKAMRNLGLGKSKWETLIQEEVNDFIKHLLEQKGRSIDVNKMLTSSVSNNIAALVFGKRLPMNDPTRDFLDESIDITSQFFEQAGIRTYFPAICDLLAALGLTRYASIRKKLIAFNNYIRKEIEERRKHLEEGDSEIYIDGYLKELENKEKNHLVNTFNEVNLRGNIQALFVGGSDTTRTSINWLLLAMAAFPDVQEKVQKEVDTVLGKEGTIQWSDRATLPYTYATIMEGQRWRTVAPLNTSRIAMEDIKICGYDIRKGTTIIANNWGQHNDTKYWKNPEKFDPERFLSDGGKQVNFKPESYVPFSYGKRNCPGETVAMIEILIYFTAMMQHFTVQPPEGQKPILTGLLGLTYQAVDQTLRLIPRE